MPNETSLNHQQDASMETESTRMVRGIRRRKLIDLIFAFTGMGLVTLALTVLALLLGQLVRDGHSRLTSGHFVKRDGFAPSIRELVGQLVPNTGNGKVGWLLRREPFEIIDASDVLDEERLEQLIDQQVDLICDLPPTASRFVEADSLEAVIDSDFVRFQRDRIRGRLFRQRDSWWIDPLPLPLDLSEVDVDSAAQAGQPVAISIGLKRDFPLQVRTLEPLVFQNFFMAMPSREAERAGIKPAIVGSVLVLIVTMLLSVPFGIAAGIWLEEYGRKNWLTALIEINIANLAGVPSIIWGLMALGLLVYYFGLGRGILTAGLTLALLVLPIVIMATREAIRAIPNHIREASYACGATKLQTVQFHILPYSLSGILTGSIIGLSRAVGETAPLITIGALTYIPFLPEFSLSRPFAWLQSGFTVLPIQMFNWISRPDHAFHENAAAAGMVLLVLTLSMNAVAIVLRCRLRKKIKW